MVSAEKRLSHHFQVQGSYIFSKTLGDGEDFFGLSEPGDVTNIRAERALAQSDTRHQGNFGLLLGPVLVDTPVDRLTVAAAEVADRSYVSIPAPPS